MFCGNCGNQIANEATFCPFCGNKTEHAPVTPVQPVYVAPVAPQLAPKKKSLAWLWILIGIIAAIAITVGVLFATGVLGGNDKDEEGIKNDPEAVAKAYIMAQLEGDIKTRLSLSPGKYQKYYEEDIYGDDDDIDEMFEYFEDYADELDIDVEIDNFDQFYEAMKKIRKAENEETYGDDYTISVEVVETTEMRRSDLEDIRDRYDNDEMEDYIDPDLIEEGMKVYVEVEVDGDEDSDSYVMTVYTVKYDGHWKVAYTTGDDRDDAED